MTTRVLIINRQLVFAVTIKQALEQTGAFEVHPFTSADPAVEYLRTHPHEVALVDFTLPNDPEIVRRLRALQPEIAVIVSPSQTNASMLIRDLGLQGVVDAPFSARSIIPLIEHAIEQIEQPFSAITRNLPGSEADVTSGETEILPGEGRQKAEESPAPKRKKPAAEEPPKPRVLETRNFESKPAAPKSDMSPTRMLDQSQLPPATPQTRVVDESDQPPKKIKPVSGGTRPLSTPLPPPPANLPEFSSLDDVLSEESPFGLEPPVGEGDTPAVPAVDSDAVRQFLATKPPASDDTFGNLLGTIDPAKEPRKSNTFDDLVNSMRGEQQQPTALPDRHQQFIDFILTGGMENLLTEIEKTKTGPLTDPDESTGTFEKLAAEEPPMPTLEESGTIGDLMLGVSDTSFRNVLAMMSGNEEAVVEEPEGRQRLSKEMEEAFAAFFEQQVEHEPPFIDESAKPIKPIKPLRSLTPDDSGAIPAQLILETTQDDSTPAESFSLNSLIVSIERQLSEHTPEVNPLPSWGQEIKLQRRRKIDDRYIKEPDFLPEEGFTSQMIPIDASAPEAAQPEEELPFEPGSLPEQEILASVEPVTDVSPVTLPDWEDIAQWDEAQPEEVYDELDDWGDVTILGEAVTPETRWEEEPNVVEPEPEISRPELPHDFFLEVDETADEHTVILSQTSVDAPSEVSAVPIELTPVQQQDEDPYIAQIALSLTQVSLELTADATLLTQSDELVAYAGTLTQDDIEEFRIAIGDEWKGEGDEARIRFIRLGSSGKDYMLYSRKTAGDFTLSMIFSTTTPLRDIRRQGKRLMEALESVPETLQQPEVAEIAEAPAEAVETPPALPANTEALTPYAYVWLANAPLTDTSTRLIEVGLPVQLHALGWQIHNVEAQNEYVYILADVPGEQPAHEIVRDLKRRTAALVLTQTPEAALSWTPGYLVMTPGRPLEPDEIEQFIRFERLQ